jgi:hypothetical protein
MFLNFDVLVDELLDLVALAGFEFDIVLVHRESD